MNVHKRHSTLLGGRRQFQPQVRPATVEPHDVKPLALHDHEPRPLPRASTNIVFLGGARPNGSRLSCGALVKDSFPNGTRAVSFRRWLGRRRSNLTTSILSPCMVTSLELSREHPQTLYSRVALGLTGRG